ncbi:amidohydrolase [Bifidobacterium catulorum]|nr:amidohydrolase [Bifidobacterium catulorum]
MTEGQAGLWHDGGMGKHETRITNARIPGTDRIVDIAVLDGVVTRIAAAGDVHGRDNGEMFAKPAYTAAYTETVNAGGRWVIPGLWDGHTHFTQWAATFGRLDLIRATSAHQAMEMLRDYLDDRRNSFAGLDPDTFIVGMRFRHSLWDDDQQPSLAAIDAVAGDQPVVLSSADMHCGWVNTAAAKRLGVRVDDSGLVGELEWFDVYGKLDDATGKEQLKLVKAAEQDAAAKGVVGICDYEMADTIAQWRKRFAKGIDRLRVRVGVYPERLEEAVAAGWQGGAQIEDSDGLGRVTTMKLIADGSLNTRSAYCSEPYSSITPETRGVMSYSPEQIEHYMTIARANGFDVACHAIGDEANTVVLDAFEHTGATGSIEHAQLLKPGDVARFRALGLVASVQPQHAVDDRDVVTRYWGNTSAIPFPYRTLYDAGVPLRFGSDAPVAVLDPWVAMAAAVYRTDNERDSYQPEQRLGIQTALESSTFGNGSEIAVGDPGDLVLLDKDPYATYSAAELRSMPVAATMCAGRWTHFAL